MRRIILMGVLVVLTACSEATVDGSGVLVAYSYYRMTTDDGERINLSVLERPNVYCSWVDLAVDVRRQWKEHALTLERHARLVTLADDPALIDRYRVDAQPPGSLRECIEGTSVCYEPGIVLSTGPLSSLGFAAYVLHIPPETDVAWTEETRQMAEEYQGALEECIREGTPIPPRGADDSG